MTATTNKPRLKKRVRFTRRNGDVAEGVTKYVETKAGSVWVGVDTKAFDGRAKPTEVRPSQLEYLS